MTDWITDRQPTEADADRDGEVVLRRFADGRRDSTTGRYDALVDWRHIGPGVPWKHTSDWEPPAQARPTLAVGQVWRRRDGKEVEIDDYNPDRIFGKTHPFWADGRSYAPDGKWIAGTTESSFDLVEFVGHAATSVTTKPRHFSSLSGYSDSCGTHYQLATATDGTAWVRHADGPWVQQPPLPGCEVIAND